MWTRVLNFLRGSRATRRWVKNGFQLDGLSPQDREIMTGHIARVKLHKRQP